MLCQVIHLGAALNPGFRKRLRVVSKLAYHLPGNFTLRVPRPPPSTIDGNGAVQQRVQRGMTAMEGSAGLVKGSSSNDDTYEHVAEAVRVDSVVTRDVCMLKADVEGYEPQVLRSASALFHQHRVAPGAGLSPCACARNTIPFGLSGVHEGRRLAPSMATERCSSACSAA